MKAISLDNDWEYEYRATRKNTATGTLEPATGLAGLYGHLSLTDAGATLDASLRVLLAERGVTGVYYGIIQGDDIRAHCASLIDTTVYEVFGDGTNVYTSIPRRVVPVRRP